MKTNWPALRSGFLILASLAVGEHDDHAGSDLQRRDPAERCAASQRASGG